MDIDYNRLLQENSARIQSINLIARRHIAFVNDYYSWNREKLLDEERRRNVIDIIMKLQGIGEDLARQFVIGMIMTEEMKLKEYMYGKEWTLGESEEMKIYVKGLHYLISGNTLYSTNTPRYHDPKFGIAMHG
jgi:hypothetical protein